MGSAVRHGNVRVIPILIISMIILAGLRPAQFWSPVSAQQTSGNAPVDLTQMSLSPADLAALEMPGYGAGFGQTLYPDDFASILAKRGLSEDQARSAVESSGFVRGYDSRLDLPADATAPAGAIGRMVVSSVREFTDVSGAASLFSLIEEGSAKAPGTVIAMSAPIGDQSVATYESGKNPDTGQLFDRIDLRFQSGRFQAEVVLLGLQGRAVRLADAERLAQRLLTRLQSGFTRDGGGLSVVALRLSLTVASSRSDQYLLVAGQAIPQYGEAAEAVDGRTSAATTDGAIDTYKIAQMLDIGSDAPDDNVWYLLDLTRFTDSAAASDWMAGLPAQISSNATFANFALLDGPTVGDESVSYTLTTADGKTRYRSVSFRIGAEVASIDLNAGTSTSPLLLKALPLLLPALANAQATCMEAGACPAPFGVHRP